MPRRNRRPRRPNWDRMAAAQEDEPTYQQMAMQLVKRGLASARILGPIKTPYDTSDPHNRPHHLTKGKAAR